MRRVACSAAAALLLPFLLWGCDEDAEAPRAPGPPNGTNGTGAEQGQESVPTMSSEAWSSFEAELEANRTPAMDAQFLIQASFGPTLRSMSELKGVTYKQWVLDQMKLPLGSHRAYWRQRVRPRVDQVGYSGGPMSRCAAGSRWTNFAFRASDKGKEVSVRGEQVNVSSTLRTRIDPNFALNGLTAPSCDDAPKFNRACSAYGPWSCFRDFFPTYCRTSCWKHGLGFGDDDCSVGWPALAAAGFTGFVCTVEDKVGGKIGLSTTSSCRDPIYMPNPAIVLLQAVDGGALAFETPGPGVLVKKETTAACALSGHSFMQRAGKFYMADDRLALEENTLGAPLGGSSTAPGLCANVARTILNAGTCQLRPSCMPVGVTSQTLHLKLDAAGREMLWTAGRQRVYQVRGLLPRDPPCGRVARWRECDAQMACAASPLSDADATALADALGRESGWLRDITVSCSGSVAIGAVVSVGSSLFKHVHPQEFDVFDFTAWVDRHPGGAFNIEKWATGAFSITVPGSHQDTTSNADRWAMGMDTGDIVYVGASDQNVSFENLPATLQTQAVRGALAVSVSEEHYEACGSPGEVASDPLLGHQSAMQLVSVSAERTWDRDRDGDDLAYRTMVPNDFSGTLWLTMSLRSVDQLRQRVAWALSQTFVTSAEDKFGTMVEPWANYYDIFVRNAFGNFKDLLREVTYSPLMGYYLSYRRNQASDWGGKYPDENYAREIMQLFTIGLEKLDGSGGQTYDNENIMDFARIFTGLDTSPRRSNIEHDRFAPNLVDPMSMKSSWHDVYPKRDLDGGYIGDGYPLCADRPLDAFLRRGAEYEFVGYVAPEGARILELRPNSPFRAALCGAASAGAACSHGLHRRLEATVACHEEECAARSVDVVKVDTGFYSYAPPACVHLFFGSGKVVTRANWNFGVDTSCRSRLVAHARVACCNDGCTDVPSWYMKSNAMSCANASTTYPDLVGKRCNQDDTFKKNKFCQFSCFQAGLGYAGDDCSAGLFSSFLACDEGQYSPETYADAEAQCTSKGMKVCNVSTGVSCPKNWDVWTPTDCAPEVEFDFSGKVMWEYSTRRPINKFSVSWVSGSPTADSCSAPCTKTAASCKCPIEVALRPAFTSLPTLEEAKLRLRIGAAPPTAGCGVCDGDVKTYGASDALDASTVIEVQGAFFRNVESVVFAGAWAFRNPPVFARDRAGSTTRTATAEVDALLEHLVRHPNTPVFFATRLIQRLVTSNPSKAYLAEVAQAFRTGYAWGGEKFSGRYGDLGAAVASALLAPEARGALPEAAAPRSGALREPLLKFVHFLRSMEYASWDGRELAVQRLNDDFGQWPFRSPSVFNFYTPFYSPRAFGDGLVAPEFQLFTAPSAIQFVNGLSDAIGYGELSFCGMRWGLTDKNCSRGAYGFALNDSTIGSDPVAQLGLLLTGGRLGASAPLVRSAYDQAEAGRKLQAAQQAIIMTPEFHTMGPPLTDGERKNPPAASDHPPASYKAFVVVFLNGGADTFNLIVPMGCDLWDQYQEVRAGVALLQNELLSIGSNGQRCGTFGVHGALPFVKQLYDGGEAAFVSNVGALAEPMSPAEFKRGNVTMCKNLFSHSDQQTAASTLQCQLAGNRIGGVGGRIADALGATGLQTNSFSLAGVATWPQGQRTDVSIVDRSRGVPRLTQYDSMKDVITGIARTQHKNIYCEEYVNQFAAAIDSSERLGGLLENATLTTSYPTQGSRIGEQLQQVARLMAARRERKAERDIFFVQSLGWDMHGEAVDELTEKFKELNDALRDFVAEVKAQGLWDSTVVVTKSDFGRTLTSNGQGTDHAWAGNHMVLGGAVQGKKVYNEYPSSLLQGGEQDIGRGRLVPKFPWESMMVPIATWLGVPESGMAGVFPNLGKFDRSSHIISRTALFKA